MFELNLLLSKRAMRHEVDETPENKCIATIAHFSSWRPFLCENLEPNFSQPPNDKFIQCFQPFGCGDSNLT